MFKKLLKFTGISRTSMENQNRSVECREIVTLILKTKLFEVDKQKLINKSRYFAALLSANYMEFHQSKHIINYEIPVLSFKDFINWIHYDILPLSTMNNENKFEHLLILLELSVLFAVDDLTEDVTDMLQTYYLLPKHVIDIWLLAQELSLNLLRDISLSVCLDCFMELPYNSLYELSKQDFLKLVGNINVRSTEPYLVHIIHEWMKLHQETIPLDIVKNKKPKILHSIISCENPNVINSNSKLYLHCWDGKNFFELTTFEYPKETWDFSDTSENRNTLSGMQIAARGYNLYLIGGEFGIGSGRFNTKIWRYSLLSKKWFLQAVMPRPRRHMIATFFKNKLLLVGGVGKYRLKLNSVDIYNVHTGIWSKGAQMSNNFTYVPDYLIFNEKLIIYNINAWFVYVYCLNQNTWKYVEINCMPGERDNMIISNPHSLITPILVPKIAPCYIDTSTPGKIILRSITEACIECCHKICKESEQIEFTEMLFDLKNKILLEQTSTSCSIKLACYLYESCQKNIIVIAYICWNECEKFSFHSMPLQYQNKFRSLLSSDSHKRFFNIIDPADLHTQSVNLDFVT